MICGWGGGSLLLMTFPLYNRKKEKKDKAWLPWSVRYVNLNHHVKTQHQNNPEVATSNDSAVLQSTDKTKRGNYPDTFKFQ